MKRLNAMDKVQVGENGRITMVPCSFKDGAYVATSQLPLYSRVNLQNSTSCDFKLEKMINCTTSMVEGRPVEEEDELSIHFVPSRKIPHAKVSSPSNSRKLSNCSMQRDGDDLPAPVQYNELSPKQLPPLHSTDDRNLDIKSNTSKNATAGRDTNNLNRSYGKGSATQTSSKVSSGVGNGSRPDKFLKLVGQIASDPTTWEDVWASEEFCAIFSKMFESRSLSAYKDMYSADRLGTYKEGYKNDPVLLEVMALALKEHEQQEEFANLRTQKLAELSTNTAILLKGQLTDEARRAQRVKSLATRTLKSHIKIDEHRTKSAASIAQKKEAALRKQEAAERRLLESKHVLAAQVVGVEKVLKEHEERRRQIEGQRAAAVTAAYEAKLERGGQSLQMQTRLLEEVQQSVIRNSSDNNKNAERLRAARELDDENRERISASIRDKEERHALRITQVREEEAQRVADNKLRQSLLEFKCEQRKRLFDYQREQNAALSKIDMEKLDAFKEVQDSICCQRSNALKQVFQESFTGSSRLAADSAVHSTPGPGEYDVIQKKKVVGGYMSGRTRELRNSMETPGPGGYEPDASVVTLTKLKEKSGVLPFRGRGRSDVDWLIMEAARRPGPGSYNFDNPNPKGGGKFGCAKLKSDLDTKLESKKGIPGPGSYNVNPGLKKQTTLAAITKTYRLSDHIDIDEGEIAELFRTYK